MVVTAPTTVSVNGNPTFVSVAAARDFTCGVTSTGSVYCWGDNGNGQLGTGFMSPDHSSTPLGVAGITNALGVSARGEFACAWLADKTVKCWGGNRDGELGDGTLVDSATPMTVKNLANAVAVAAGDYHACALLGDGTVSCWGSSYYGQVGSNVTGEFTSPLHVQGL
jgi:alpha-tubulin suppressor-like RCC1 family protein